MCSYAQVNFVKDVHVELSKFTDSRQVRAVLVDKLKYPECWPRAILYLNNPMIFVWVKSLAKECSEV